MSAGARWNSSVKQVEYEVTLAARRYEAVDPDNRLVAAELEVRWNAALARLRECQARLADGTEAGAPSVTRESLLMLATDLEAAWHAPTTDMRTKQRRVRALIEEIVVDVDDATREVVLIIHWRGGQHSEVRVRKPGPGEHTKRTSADAGRLIREMATRWSDADIAVTLNRLGLTTGQGNSWNERRVGNYRRKAGIPSYESAVKNGRCLTMLEAAQTLGVTCHVIRALIRDGILPARQVVFDAPWQIRAADLQRPAVHAGLGRRRTRRGGPYRNSGDTRTFMIPGTSAEEGHNETGLTRHRKVLIQDRTREVNRLHKLLEDAGIKLASVATVLGALVTGTTDPDILAELARGKLRAKRSALRQALTGRFRPHHAFLVSQLLAHVDYLDETIATVSEQIEAAIAPFAEEVARLDTIHGVAQRTAEVLIAELGVDMRQFPSARHLASWAALCPGNNESAGKHESGKTRRGNRWLRAALTEAALAAIRTSNSAFAARYRRVMRHRGHKKAVIAVAHAMLVTVYHVLARQTPYRELGADYYDHRHLQRARRRAVETLERQGYRVMLEPAA
jgi:transposase